MAEYGGWVTLGDSSPKPPEKSRSWLKPIHLTKSELLLTAQRLDNVEARLDRIDGCLDNLEGGEYERTVKTKALARTQIVLGFDGARVALNREGLVDPQLNSAVALAFRDGRVSGDGYAGLFDTDLVISARDNRHAVVEVSITADADDISSAKERSGILANVTGGTVTPVVITSRLDPAQSAQAEAEGVRVFVIPYP